MGIISRISNIVAARVNELLDQAENHEAMLANVIREMDDGLAEARRFAAVAIASERRLHRELEDSRTCAAQWRERARKALEAGREELARQALAQKHKYDQQVGNLEEQHRDAAKTGQAARDAIHALERRLVEARQKYRALLARHRTARIRAEVHRNLGAGSTDLCASITRFEQVECLLRQHADELDAEADLYERSVLEVEFIDLERNQAIDRELTILKDERSGT